MSLTLNYTEQSYTKPLNKSAKFVLIGNNIDGFVDIDVKEFPNFIDLKERLPEILIKLECRGEWDLKLYQYLDSYDIEVEFGYYKAVKNGTEIFNHDYMDYTVVEMNFYENHIQILGAISETNENWLDDSKDFLQTEVELHKIEIHFT